MAVIKKTSKNRLTNLTALIVSIIAVVLLDWWQDWTLTNFEAFIMIVVFWGGCGVWVLVDIFRRRSMPKPPRGKSATSIPPSISEN